MGVPRRGCNTRRRDARRPVAYGAMTSTISAHPQYALAALVGWVVLYLVYKFAWRRDYGLPVRRRLLMRSLQVEREQIAYVPFWWSDLQVQRAIDNHWRRTMRLGFERRPPVAR